MTTRRKHLSRRRVLEALGASAAFLPLLPATEPRRAHAASPYPKRLLVLLQTNGTITDQFFPQGTGTALSGLTLGEVTAPLNPHKEDLVFVENLELKNFTDYPKHGAGHENYASVFLGAKGRVIQGPAGPRFVGGSPSFDQFIADKLTAQTKLPFRSLTMGVLVGGGFEGNHQSRCFYRGEGQEVSPEQDPARVFNTLFAGGVQPGAGAANLKETLERLRIERKSALDHLGPSLEAFAKRVSAADRPRIQAHLQAIRDLEMQLGAGSGSPLACENPRIGAVDARKNDDYPRILDAELELALAAFRCDLTRVVGIQLANGNGNTTEFPWIGLAGAGMEYARRTWHDVAHRNGAGGKDKIKLDNWFMVQLAKVIQRLKDTKEGDGTMLDNTIILHANHMGNGGAHNSNRLPWVIATGKKGGLLKTGQYIRGAFPTNGVMHGIINAMGVSSQGFGDPKYGGEIASLR